MPCPATSSRPASSTAIPSGNPPEPHDANAAWRGHAARRLHGERPDRAGRGLGDVEGRARRVEREAVGEAQAGVHPRRPAACVEVADAAWPGHAVVQELPTRIGEPESTVAVRADVVGSAERLTVHGVEHGAVRTGGRFDELDRRRALAATRQVAGGRRRRVLAPVVAHHDPTGAIHRGTVGRAAERRDDRMLALADPPKVPSTELHDVQRSVGGDDRALRISTGLSRFVPLPPQSCSGRAIAIAAMSTTPWNTFGAQVGASANDRPTSPVPSRSTATIAPQTLKRPLRNCVRAEERRGECWKQVGRAGLGRARVDPGGDDHTGHAADHARRS